MKKHYSLALAVVLQLCCAAYLQASNPTATAGNPVTHRVAAVPFNGAQAWPGKLVVRVLPAYRDLCSPAGIADPKFQEALGRIQAVSVQRKYPNLRQPVNALNRYGRKPIDMSLVYEVRFDPRFTLSEAIQSLMGTGLLAYAEPLYLHNFDYTTNDPDLSSQYHITKIQAPAAWDIQKGDTNVSVGIVDSGTDWDHPDLQANIKYNYADPIDGVDNDADGYIDNYRGWDVSENDNDPMVVSQDHGSHVSGCAAAVTDNATGVASPGFRCRFVGVKASLDGSTTSIDNGYDGIVYAATVANCDIVNCSWGRPGGPSTFEEEVIDLVTFDYDALVVAAAGNSSSDMDHYPSSYRHAFSVASTTITDGKSGFSNYGYNVDIAAPGSNIYSTVFNNNYVSYSGTSMASPVVAGCAALVKSQFPSMNALQIAEQLRTTSDNIYTVSGNSAYRDKLGKGRVNLFRAVSDSLSPGVIVEQVVTRDGNDGVFVIGDTLQFVATFKNLLRPTTALACSMTTGTPAYMQVIQSSFTIGALGTLDTVSNFSIPFKAVVQAGTPTNQAVTFRLVLTDGSWTDAFAFRVTVNVDYINIAVNDVATSITSKGLIGYNQSGQIEGLGFTYMGGPTILYEMGLMVGASGTQVSDYVRGDGGTYDSDFSSFRTVSSQEPGTVSDFDAYGQFVDNGPTSSTPLPILVSHRAYAWAAPAADRKYIIVDYTIRNNGVNTLNNLYAGIFADWDVPQYANNKADTDAGRKMGYTWSTDAGGIWAGIKLLTSGGFNHYAVDNVTGGNGGLDLSDGFSNAEKYSALSTSRSPAGNTATTGNDVIDVVSSGPFTLASGDSVRVAFALIAGEDLTMIQASADAAQVRWDNTVLTTGLTELPAAGAFGLTAVYPNPAGNNAMLLFDLDRSGSVELVLYNALGEQVQTVLAQTLGAGAYSIGVNLSELGAGSYFVRLTSNGQTSTRPLHIVR